MLRKLLLTISLVASVVFPALVPAAAFAAAEGIEQNLCAGANLDVNTDCNNGGITDQQARDRINNILRTVINLFSLVVGVVAVIMIIIGGLKYITSGGDSGNVSGAKNTILYAIIGIVVVALSQFIVRFVLTKING
jgi:cytochrome bd-type quinol oxidase subunit 2